MRMGTRARAPGPLQREDYANGTGKSTGIVGIPTSGQNLTDGRTLRPSLLHLENASAKRRIAAVAIVENNMMQFCATSRIGGRTNRNDT